MDFLFSLMYVLLNLWQPQTTFAWNSFFYGIATALQRKRLKDLAALNAFKIEGKEARANLAEYFRTQQFSSMFADAKRAWLPVVKTKGDLKVIQDFFNQGIKERQLLTRQALNAWWRKNALSFVGQYKTDFPAQKINMKKLRQQALENQGYKIGGRINYGHKDIVNMPWNLKAAQQAAHLEYNRTINITKHFFGDDYTISDAFKLSLMKVEHNIVFGGNEPPASGVGASGGASGASGTGASVNVPFEGGTVNIENKGGEKVLTFWFKGSSWLVKAEYYVSDQLCALTMMRGKRPYNFYDVPLAALQFLLVANGKQMWNGFGFTYSKNPMYWIRKAQRDSKFLEGGRWKN